MFWSPENEGDLLNGISKQQFIAESSNIRTRMVELTEPVSIEDLEAMSKRAAGNVKIAIDESGRTFGLQHAKLEDYEETKASFKIIKNIGRIGPITSTIHILRDLHELELLKLSQNLVYTETHIIFSTKGSYRLVMNNTLNQFISDSGPSFDLDYILREVFLSEDFNELLDINEDKLKTESQKQKDYLSEFTGIQTFLTVGEFTTENIGHLTNDQQTKLFNIMISVDSNLVSQLLSNIMKTPVQVLVSFFYEQYKVEVILQGMPLIDLDSVRGKLKDSISVFERNITQYEKALEVLDNHRDALILEHDDDSMPYDTFEYLLKIANYYSAEHSKFQDPQWSKQMQANIIQRRLKKPTNEDKDKISEFLVPLNTEALMNYLRK